MIVVKVHHYDLNKSWGDNFVEVTQDIQIAFRKVYVGIKAHDCSYHHGLNVGIAMNGDVWIREVNHDDIHKVGKARLHEGPRG